MSVVSLLGVKVLNNPAKFTDPYVFEITFECLEQLREDLEWKLTYVGSATSAEHDQELDSLLVGPIPVGVNKFLFEADSPDMKRLPSSEIIGVTVILLTCSYDGREFVRVGYYVNNEYDSEELQNEPPAKPIIEKVRRNVLAEKPRVTRFAIKWDSEDSAPAEYPPDQPEADTLDDDGTNYGVEEADMQAALERELAEEEAKADKQPADADADQAMVGTEAPKHEDDASDAESEDLEAESSDDDEDEEEEEGGEGDGDEDMEMADGEEKPSTGTESNGNPKSSEQHQPEVMVH